jgi:hypothetical protein
LPLAKRTSGASALTANQVIAALISLSVFLLLWIIDNFGWLLPSPARGSSPSAYLDGLVWSCCNQKNMDKADAMLMKMPDGENKTNGMQEMTSAKSSMSQKDMAGCQDHMNDEIEENVTKKGR